MGGAFSICAGGAAARGDPAAAPFFLRSGARAPPGRVFGRAGGLPLPWAGLLFPLRSCARVAEDGVFRLLYVAFLDTTEPTSSISPFARFLQQLSGFYSGDAVAFSFSFIS